MVPLPDAVRDRLAGGSSSSCSRCSGTWRSLSSRPECGHITAVRAVVDRSGVQQAVYGGASRNAPALPATWLIACVPGSHCICLQLMQPQSELILMHLMVHQDTAPKLALRSAAALDCSCAAVSTPAHHHHPPLGTSGWSSRAAVLLGEEGSSSPSPSPGGTSTPPSAWHTRYS
jgi:hypothetical protein